jgi:hypothetical protein
MARANVSEITAKTFAEKGSSLARPSTFTLVKSVGIGRCIATYYVTIHPTSNPNFSPARRPNPLRDLSLNYPTKTLLVSSYL